MFVLRIPARYMRADASEDDKQIYEYYKQVLADLQNGAQKGLILPSDVCPDSRAPLFTLEWVIADTDKL